MYYRRSFRHNSHSMLMMDQQIPSKAPENSPITQFFCAAILAVVSRLLTQHRVFARWVISLKIIMTWRMTIAESNNILLFCLVPLLPLSLTLRTQPVAFSKLETFRNVICDYEEAKCSFTMKS